MPTNDKEVYKCYICGKEKDADDMLRVDDDIPF